MSAHSFFDQFLNDYFSESEEHLTNARNLMLTIESAGPNKPVDANVLDELLRNFHSVKGLSAMVGLEEATQLAHHIEDYLKELKRPYAVISREAIERVVGGIVAMEQVLEAKRTAKPIPDVSLVLLHLEAVTAEIQTSAEQAPKSTPDMWQIVFRSSADRARQGVTVSAVREQLKQLGEIVQASPQVLDDGQIAFQFTIAASVSESAFDSLRSDGIEVSRVLEEHRPPGAHDDLPTIDGGVKVGTHNVIRVEMSRLDELMRNVGELVIMRYRFDELLRRIPPGTADWNALSEINIAMERQVRSLRDGVLGMRMVPIGHVFDRMRFVARGLERELNRAVQLITEGSDTEIDKVVVDRMMEPLLHLTRNAIGHGLESAQTRIAAGKSASGTIRLSAKAAGDVVTIDLEDDGCGIDATAVSARARALGWLGKEDTFDPKLLLDFICSPGFTTREEADVTSGRGIGMASVKAAVSELGGSLTMTTQQGQGTRFSLRLPLTLLIADALMVTVGKQRFAVPQTAVREVLSVESSAVRVFENNEAIPFRGAVLPLVRLSRFFGLPASKLERFHVLVIVGSGAATGLVVDRITGQREIVVQAATDPLFRVPGVVGATELGDGRPVLILEPYSVISAARMNIVEVPS